MPKINQAEHNHITSNGQLWWVEEDKDRLTVFSFKGGPEVISFITDMGSPELEGMQEILAEKGRSRWGL